MDELDEIGDAMIGRRGNKIVVAGAEYASMLGYNERQTTAVLFFVNRKKRRLEEKFDGKELLEEVMTH